jgi:dTDP-4-amino-4,6-dideoxygalactose transaminase
VALVEINPLELARSLAKLGIETRPVFYPLTSMPAFSSYHAEGNDRVATKLSKVGISLPTWTQWTESNWGDLAKAIESSIDELR